MPCFCTPHYLCAACRIAIDAAEDARDNPPSDYRDDYLDNYFEQREHPRLWN